LQWGYSLPDGQATGSGLAPVGAGRLHGIDLIVAVPVAGEREAPGDSGPVVARGRGCISTSVVAGGDREGSPQAATRSESTAADRLSMGRLRVRVRRIGVQLALRLVDAVKEP
jgi:hypothetical protein